MGEACEHDVLDLVELMLDGSVDAGVGVTKEIGPPRADAVHEDESLVVCEPSARALDHAQGGRLLVLFHLSARVPNTLQ